MKWKTLAFTSVLLPSLAFADNGFVLVGGDKREEIPGPENPLCIELDDIINLPANAHAIGVGWETEQIKFPRRYTHFSTPDWKDMPDSELPQHMDMKDFAAVQQKFRGTAKDNSQWDGKGDFIYQKSRIDIDNTHHPITVIRYRLPTWHNWKCSLSNEAFPNYIKSFNGAHNQEAGAADDSMGMGCNFFTYKGETYYAHDLSSMTVRYMSPLTYGGSVNSPELSAQHVCSIELEHPRKKSERYFQHFIDDIAKHKASNIGN